MPSLRVAAAQLNPVVGDLDANTDLVIAAIEQATAQGCDLVAFPELVLTGYPPEDLLLKEGFVADAVAALERAAAATERCVAIIGAVVPAGYGDLRLGEAADARPLLGRRLAAAPLANAAVVCAKGRIVDVIAKRLLPNYAVFDEQRWFLPGVGPHPLFRIAGTIVGMAVCEDLWSPAGPAATMA